MNDKLSFRNIGIVSCGTLRLELNALREEGFLNAEGIFYTTPGLHEEPTQLETQLKRQVRKAKENSKKVIVVYGAKCFVDYDNPSRDIDVLLREEGPSIFRVSADDCVDMLADTKKREEIAGGQKVYWLTPGWLVHWKHIFRGWDAGKANETFPQNDKAILLDGIGFFEQYLQQRPEEVLEFSDWMKVAIESRTVSLDRLRKLLSEQVQSGI